MGDHKGVKISDALLQLAQRIWCPLGGLEGSCQDARERGLD